MANETSIKSLDPQSSSNLSYPVKDLSIASFLLASGELKLIKVEKIDKAVHFHFSPRQQAENLTVAYLSETAPSIQPRKLFDSMQNLKNLIFSSGG